MYYYKYDNRYISTLKPQGLPEISKEEFDAKMLDIESCAQVAAKISETKRPLTESEVLALLIPKQINMLDVDDNTALRMKGFYPAFESVIGQTVKQGFKFTYADKLWKTEQPEMMIQEHYAPGVGTESLYSEVCETHAGTKEDPIPYSGNMELKAGLYYMQNWEIYLCTRDSIYPVHNTLADLVGLYVEKA